MHHELQRNGAIAGHWPVSIKGVVVAAGQVLLLANERDEWELPGGRLEAGESPEQCVMREVTEETGLSVEVAHIVDAWAYPVLADRTVFVVTYACRPLFEVPELVVSAEHRDARFVPLGECDDYRMPDGYRRAIAKATR